MHLSGRIPEPSHSPARGEARKLYALAMTAATRTVYAPGTTQAPASPIPRYTAVDALRGLTIAFMILVNNGDERASFWALKHAAWNGFTPTDLVFPTFLLLVGCAIVFSTEARLARGATRISLFGHTVRRAVILFLLGLSVNSFPLFRLSTMRYYGVLQRIALCYLIVGTLYLLVRTREDKPAVWDKVTLLVACLLGYYLLMRLVPVPGFGLPGRDVPLLDRDNNLVAWLDRSLFSAPHLYEGTRDPEGLLSTIPALGTTLIGVLAGLFLRAPRSDRQKALGLAVAGAGGVILGLAWNPLFPINKKLWTSSYVLFAAGWSLLLLALFWYLVQMRRAPQSRRRTPPWTAPLMVFGTNAIAAYCCAEWLAGGLEHVSVAPHLTVPRWVYLQIVTVIPWPPLASLTYALLFVLVCWLAVLPLYRKRIFIKI
jgi:predicted acyltransferase